MAKKAKRRGRPRGSKNKKKKVGLAKSAKNFAAMEIGQLKSYIDNLQDVLSAKIQQQRDYLQGQLDGLAVYANNKAGKAIRAVMQVPKQPQKSVRRKAEPKYQSMANKKLKWSGRGMLPVWMREEMKGTKLTKDDFAIK